MNKTAHELARELLALPDHPIYHFDPSLCMARKSDNVSVAMTEPRIFVETGIEELGPVVTINGYYDDSPQLALRSSFSKSLEKIKRIVSS